MTDNVASWVKSGFVAGPFDTPPCEKFRVNALVAVEQNQKVRPCLNVSLPEGKSLNDNVNKCELEKVHMSSARLFGYAIREAGQNSVMSKFDMRDAYKNIPAMHCDLRLQGFIWLGKFWVELKQTFGAVASVCNYDKFGNTIQALTRTFCDIPSRLCQRQLDDNPVVSPAGTNWCEQFSEEYTRVCKMVNVKLAEDCPEKDKAFTNQTSGKVLGIWFDTVSLKWRLPVEKSNKALTAIHDIYKSETVNLLTMQKLLGRLNDIALMCPFLSAFRRPINELCTEAGRSASGTARVSDLVKNDLELWSAVIGDCAEGLPIPSLPVSVPLSHKSFAVHAVKNQNLSHKSSDAGIGCYGSNEDGMYLSKVSFLWNAKAYRDLALFENHCTLILAGILLSLTVNFRNLKNQHIVFLTNNITCVWAWDKKYASDDIRSSILIRCIVILAAYLGSEIHIDYKKDPNSWEFISAERLSRDCTTSNTERTFLRRQLDEMVPRDLQLWLSSWSEDWSLPGKLANSLP
jgi:hypothetical protein